MRRIAAAVLTAAGIMLGAFSAPSMARVVGSVAYQPHQAPVPAGDRGVAWLDDARLDGPGTLWTASYVAKPRRVQRLAGGPDVGVVDLTASATHVALLTREFGPGPPREPAPYEDVRASAGQFGRPLQDVAGCRIAAESPSGRLVPGPFQLDGSVLLFSRGEGCREVVERDLALGAGSDRPTGRPGVFLVRAAGRFLAWLEYDPGAPASSATAAVVQDRVEGREVTRVPLSSRPQHLSLRDDGTLVLSLGPTIRIAEPGAAEARELPIKVSDSLEPVPWVGRHLAVTSSNSPATLQLIDTNGRVARRLVEVLPDVSTTIASAINDTHVTWLSRGCRGVLINARPLTAPGTVHYRPDRYRCRLRRAGPTVLEARRLRLGVSCRSFTLGCWASITVRLGHRVIAKGIASRRYRNGKAARATLSIHRSARRLLPPSGRVKLRLTARYRNTDSVRRSTIVVRRHLR